MSSGPRLPVPTWIVGCGNMAGAMVEGWRLAEVDLSAAVAIRPSGTPVPGVRTVSSMAEAGAAPRMVVLGFKPQKLDEVAPQLATWITSKTIVVSILAGLELESLRDRFPRAAAVVRAMPNLPVAVRRGVVALLGDADAGARQELEPLFGSLGLAIWTNTEAQLAAVGSLAGAGPAYVARYIDALAAAGVERGLSPEFASTVALETVFGTAWLAASTKESMNDVARRVASPNGTTQAGLAVLDRELPQLVSRTIKAAAQRGAELAAEARGPAMLSTDVGGSA